MTRWDRARWWVNDDAPIWVTTLLHRPFNWLYCRFNGHTPIRDMCNLPEHDYCCICRKWMPGAAGEAGIGKPRHSGPPYNDQGIPM